MGKPFSLFNILKLRDIVSFLNQGEIQPHERFLSIYDNGNSIWESSEIQHIRQDFNSGRLNSIYSNYLSNCDEEQELDYEENYLLKKNLDNLTPEETQRLSQLIVLNNNTAQIENSSLIKIAKLDEKRFNKFKEYLLDTNKQVNAHDIEYLINLDAENFEKAEKYIYIEKRGENQLDGIDIVDILSMDEKEREELDKYLVINERNEQISLVEIKAILKLPEKEKNFVDNLLRLKSSDGSDRFKFHEFGILPFEDFTNISNSKEFTYIEGRGDNQFSLHDLLTFSKLSEDERIKLKKLAYVEERRDSQFKASDMVELMKLSDEKLLEMRKYFYIEGHKTQYTGKDIVNLARLDKKDLKRLEPLMYIENRGNDQFSGEDLVNFANLSDKELKKLKKYAYYEERGYSQFSQEELIELVKMPKQTIEELEPYFGLPIDGKQPSLNEIKELYSIFNEDYSVMLDLIDINPDINTYMLIQFGNLCKLNKEMVMKTYSMHPNAKIYNDEIIDFSPDYNKVYDYNPRLNSMNISRYKHKKGVSILDSQTIKKYDKNNNLIEVRKSKKGGIDSVPIISVTKNGKSYPIQYSSIDPNSGSIIISKNFVSPNNIKTDYYIEQTQDGITILTYKIVDGNKEESDKDKSVLLDRQLTIQQVEENKIITTIKNDKSYEVTREADKLTVKDLESGKIKEIDVNSFTTDEKSKECLLQVLFSTPGNILNIINSNKMRFEFNDAKDLNSGSCGLEGNKLLIALGKQLYSTSDKDESLLYVYLHEFGHLLNFDFDTERFSKISNNEDLINVFKKEYQAFIENSDYMIQNAVSYLTNSLDEVVAEVNMLLNGVPDLLSAERISILQEYFPETIALIAKLLNQRIEDLYNEELEKNKDAQ